MIFFYINLLECFYFNQRIIIYFYLIIFLFKWIRNFEEMSPRNEKKFCRNGSFEKWIRNERRAYESVDETAHVRLCLEKRRKNEFGP